MRISRGVWVGTVALAAAAACSHGDDTSFAPLGMEGGAPHYDSGAEDAPSPQDSGHDGTADAPAEASGDEGVVEASVEGAAEASSPMEGGEEAAAGEAGAEAGADAGREAESDAGVEAGVDASVEAEAAAPEAGVDAGVDAPVEASLDAGADATEDARADAISVVAPVCDGIIGPNEYGGTDNQAAAASGQTWLMTWDETNLYLAIENADILEGSIVYLGVPGIGLTSGALYDSTDVTTLPFSVQLVVYAHDGYTEGRPVYAGAWGAPDTTSVRLCDSSTMQVREEVIPWTLLGGRPAAFGWTGYLAANGHANPTGFIYGQMPTSNPAGSPANNATFTKYYEVSDATPGLGRPFAVIQ